MRVSRNELTASLKKAFEGLGFSVGDYQDAAAMVTWSEIHGLKGLQQLQDAFPSLYNRLCLHAKLISNDDNYALLDGQSSSILLCGSQTVRLACALARQHGSAQVQLDNCHNRRFIAQRLVSAAQSDSALVAYWVEGDSAFKFSIESGAKQPIYFKYASTALSADQSLMIFVGNDLSSVEAQFSAVINPGPPIETTSSDTMINSYKDMLEQGIEIDDNLWHELDNLVARVLVESTESSRAGAGD
jgi:LDH2 family malate/lactate/ureidoglycolate dehydrogenase